MKLEKLQWKLFFKNPKAVNPESIFRVFSGWIENSKEVFADVASYTHVSDGPLVVLVGYECEYWLDDTGKELGFLYGSRQPPRGETAIEKMKSSLAEFLKKAEVLSAAKEVNSAIEFDLSRLQFTVNDRLDAPNTPESFAEIKQSIESLFSNMKVQIDHNADPRERLAVTVKLSGINSLAQLLEL